LRDLGHALLIYSNDNNGWLIPCWRSPASGETIPHWGTAVPPHERWPMKVFKIQGAPYPPKYDANQYDPQVYQPDVYPAAPYTPAQLICPNDLDPYEAHTYVLNAHPVEKVIKAGSHNFGGLTVSDVVMAGEKHTFERDYYMQQSDFDRVIDRYRHGPRLGA